MVTCLNNALLRRVALLRLFCRTSGGGGCGKEWEMGRGGGGGGTGGWGGGTPALGDCRRWRHTLPRLLSESPQAPTSKGHRLANTSHFCSGNRLGTRRRVQWGRGATRRADTPSWGPGSVQVWVRDLRGTPQARRQPCTPGVPATAPCPLPAACSTASRCPASLPPPECARCRPLPDLRALAATPPRSAATPMPRRCPEKRGHGQGQSKKALQ